MAPAAGAAGRNTTAPLCRTGRGTDALVAYEELRKRLLDALGPDPGSGPALTPRTAPPSGPALMAPPVPVA